MKFYVVYCVETRMIHHYCNSQDDALQYILDQEDNIRRQGIHLRWRVGEYGDLHPDNSVDNWCFELFARNDTC